jgi:hypothetical protein
MDPMNLPNQLIERLINSFKAWLTPDFFRANEVALVRAASYATPVAAVTGFLFGIIAAIKMDSFLAFALGVIWVVVLAIAYYVGSSFLETCRRTIENSRTTISSQEFLNTSALLMIVAFVLVLGFGAYLSIAASNLMALQWALPLAIALLYYACLFLNPSLMSTDFQPGATAGEDALSILIIFSKAAIRLAGIVFGLMAIIGSLLLLYSLVNLFSEGAEQMMYGGLQSVGGATIIVYGLLFPFFIYIGFVFSYLLVDICKAILSLHRRG